MSRWQCDPQRAVLLDTSLSTVTEDNIYVSVIQFKFTLFNLSRVFEVVHQVVVVRERTYRCRLCRTQLAYADDLVSRVLFSPISPVLSLCFLLY